MQQPQNRLARLERLVGAGGPTVIRSLAQLSERQLLRIAFNGGSIPKDPEELDRRLLEIMAKKEA